MSGGVTREERPSGFTAEHALLLIIILIAIVIRSWGVQTKSLWVDEARALWVAQHDLDWVSLHVGRPGSHELPGRYFLMHWLAGAFENVDFAIRLPALYGGILLIPLIWGLGNQLGGRPTGIFAAVLATVSPMLIEHSQDARYYSLLLLFEMGAFSALLAAWRHPRRMDLWIAVGLCAALACHVTLVAGFVVGAIGACLAFTLFMAHILSTREDRTAMRWGALVAILCLGLAMLPSAGFLIRMVGNYLGIVATPQPQAFALSGFAPPHRWIPTWESLWLAELVHPSRLATCLVIGLALVGLWFVWKRCPRALPPLGLILILTVALAFGTGARHNLAPRYLIHLHVLAILLAGCSLGALWRGNPLNPATLQPIMALVLTVALVASALPASWRVMTMERQNWRDAVALIEENFQPGDAIFTGAYWSEMPVMRCISDPEVGRALNINILVETDLNYLLQFRASAWYIGWGELPEFIQQHLDRDFTLVGYFEGLRGDVYVWKKGAIPEGL